MWLHGLIYRRLVSRTGTCIRRARPMAGWGISPSPAISLGIYNHHPLGTRPPTPGLFPQHGGLADPGLPSSRMLLPVSMTSRMMSMVPKTARPTRQVRPMISPCLLRMADIRCGILYTRRLSVKFSHPLEHCVDVFSADFARKDDKPVGVLAGLSPNPVQLRLLKFPCSSRVSRTN